MTDDNPTFGIYVMLMHSKIGIVSPLVENLEESHQMCLQVWQGTNVLHKSVVAWTTLIKAKTYGFYQQSRKKACDGKVAICKSS